MVRKYIALAVALVGIAISACAGGHVGGSNLMPGQTVRLPNLGDLAVWATMPKDTIGEELPTQGLGEIKSVKWSATLGGYTQQTYSQSLGFPPNTKITIKNLSSSTPHTLNVVKIITGPPAVFPAKVNLSLKAHGNGVLAAGYASGPIQPGKTVTVQLSKDGIYLIGCAYHYHEGMHDVLVVGRHAAPGPQATGTLKASATPSSRSSWDP